MAAATGSDPVRISAERYLGSPFLCERAARIDELAHWIAGFGEFRQVACHRRALHAAVWFQDTWCCDDVRASRFPAAAALAIQPTAIQRERAADIAVEQLRDVVDEGTRTTAARIIRQAGHRDSVLLEAQIVREATILDAVGPLWLWGQVARVLAEDRPVASVIAVWERQAEYQYWAELVNDTLRFDRSRQLARQRCSVLEGFFLALRDQLTGADRHTPPPPDA